MGAEYTCPWCGAVETNAWLLQNNHWVKSEPDTYDWCAAHGMCVAMSLTRAHVQAAAMKPAAERAEQLPRYIARARDVWQKAGTEWLDEYEALTKPLAAPAHHAVPLSADADLFGGVA